MTTTRLTKEQVERLRYWVRRGKGVHVGFTMLLKEAMDKEVSPNPEQVWMAGAMFLFDLMMNIVDSGTEPTDTDDELMACIDKELRESDKELQLLLAPTSKVSS